MFSHYFYLISLIFKRIRFNMKFLVSMEIAKNLIAKLFSKLKKKSLFLSLKHFEGLIGKRLA